MEGDFGWHPARIVAKPKATPDNLNKLLTLLPPLLVVNMNLMVTASV